MDSKELRRIMGHFATGVTIVTTKDAAETPFGLTANSFASLSLDPPLVLVCVDKAAQCYSCFVGSGHFAVNVLAEHQEEVSRRFATKGVSKFDGIAWRASAHGLALIEGAIGHIECKIVYSYEGGDHTIYVGEVLHAAGQEGRPLLFYKGKYHRLPE
ncbi:MAG TPA: flavin reductase family protein [Verrucomicrobiae bacterium]|jgi:flavin reductase (DIM6/NTAB) family NADH-FMN oxidoreductase RutF|nr:flavin reductase family protein [Verrucomicrobiae bacterium]